MSATKKVLPDGYAFYDKIGRPKYICAPMVDQSELAFRLLTKKYGINCGYTPMIHSKEFLKNKKYRINISKTCANDRPVIAQFCGNDPDLLLKSVKLIENSVDAIDINLGCPQNIAKRGNYGAFLLTKPDIIESLIKKLCDNISIPVCAKIRILNDDNDTIKLCKLIRNAGASILAIHGRTIKEKKHETKYCNWDIIKKVKSILDIPVFVNGGCETLEHVNTCLKYTKCDGYMAAESLLSNPAMFMSINKQPKPIDMAIEYINLANKYREHGKCIRGHLFKILYRELSIFIDIRIELATCDDEGINECLNKLIKRIKIFDKYPNIYKILLKMTRTWYHRYSMSYMHQKYNHKTLEIINKKLDNNVGNDMNKLITILNDIGISRYDVNINPGFKYEYDNTKRHSNNDDIKSSDIDSDSDNDIINNDIMFDKECGIFCNNIFNNDSDTDIDTDSDLNADLIDDDGFDTDSSQFSLIYTVD